MGNKRKHEDSEETISRKIQKLELKLLRKKNRSRIIIYSSDSSDENFDRRSEDEAPSSPGPPARPISPPSQSPPESPSTTPLPEPCEPLPSTSAETEIVLEKPELDEDILHLLGDALKSGTPLGPPIHKDVASRYQEILAKGLAKDIKEKILEEYLAPNNCDFLIAPMLNPEAKAALSEPLVKRDAFLMQKQKQLGVALSALASATSLILSNETSKQKLLKPISDACRILCDNHFVETKSRRNLVISSTNTQLKDTLIESVRDKSWLFGENISDKLRAAKSIQKSGDDLKNQPKPRPNFQGKSNRGRLNYKLQHRKTENKIAFSSDSGRGRYQPRLQTRNMAPTTTRTTHRSPPAQRRTTYK